MTNLPDGSVIITPNEVYREMQDISRKVDNLAAIVDPALTQLRADVAETQSAVQANSVRIGALENWRWFVVGAAGVVAAVAGSTSGFVLVRLFGGGN